ncbi:hypothetical protein ACQ4WP_17755, partial [Janthinobacterium sp. GB4P2]|uniref:hypothetical protein n=1 Tax=Janthinobacterium sp. GB4P2 TaxID=3424189 RepID=UPI003F24D34D
MFSKYLKLTAMCGIILDAGLAICLESCDYVPFRSWPLFKARHVLRTLLHNLNQPPSHDSSP